MIPEEDAAFKANQERVRAENEASLRKHLRDRFEVSEDFMDLAVRIWWDGKED